jgi:hypothetical protein
MKESVYKVASAHLSIPGLAPQIREPIHGTPAKNKHAERVENRGHEKQQMYKKLSQRVYAPPVCPRSGVSIRGTAAGNKPIEGEKRLHKENQKEEQLTGDTSIVGACR